VKRRVKDKRVLRLIGRYLRAGMMEGGLMSPRTEGTPQGGPLGPPTQSMTSRLTGSFH
jgi:retron-type reverse transcriptase